MEYISVVALYFGAVVLALMVIIIFVAMLFFFGVKILNRLGNNDSTS